jgi:spore germination cell wall hydrolase CwlJ-like protein
LAESIESWKRTLQPPKYRHRRSFAQNEFELETPRQAGALRDMAPYVFGGIMLVAAFAFAGHQIGRNAIASPNYADIEVPAATPTTDSVIKGSLLPTGDNFESIGFSQLRRQVVMSDGKGDMAVLDAGEAPALSAPEVLEARVEPVPVLKPVRKVAKLAEQRLKIEPASVNLTEEAEPKAKKVLKKLAIAAKPDDIDQSFKLNKAQKQKVVAQRRVRQAEENCLARAVYFEARSESELGQMAVAKVILNRVKSPDYPNSICGVVYQGSQRRNSCQFSFACDGQADDVRQPESWSQAKRIAQRAIQGDKAVAARMQGALFYHADYVNPKWARSMRKVMKVGRHIFYAGG